MDYKDKRNKETNIEEKPINPNTEPNKLQNPADPDAGSESGIPGTGKKGNIANPAAEAGLGDNQGKGTSNYPNQE